MKSINQTAPTDANGKSISVDAEMIAINGLPY